MTKTKPLEAQLQFYSKAILELRMFKDHFRNAVSHTRAYYDEHQARSAIIHVSAFMIGISEQISSTSRTPPMWTKRQLSA